MAKLNIFEEAKIGDVVFGVHQHYYEDPKNSSITLDEYIVTAETVRKHLEYGYKEVMTCSNGHLYYYQTKDFGKKVFFSPKEAAREAEQRTIHHDSIWTEYGEAPMRRTFMRYLEEADEQRT